MILSNAQEIALSGNRAYVSRGRDGIQAFDYSDPSAPFFGATVLALSPLAMTHAVLCDGGVAIDATGAGTVTIEDLAASGPTASGSPGLARPKTPTQRRGQRVVTRTRRDIDYRDLHRPLRRYARALCS